MADLNNLLGELEEQEEAFFHDDDDNDENKALGLPSVETAATEPMTAEDWDSSPSSSAALTGGGYASIPAALQEAKRRRDEDIDYKNNDDGGEMGISDLDGLWGGDGALSGTQEGYLDVNEVYTKLHQFWHQERHCPEILEYDASLVEDLQHQMQSRQEWIDQVLEEAAAAAGSNAGEMSVQHLLATLAQVDLDRLKYVLANWMAERLSKVEAHPLHMREKVDHLSDAELAYLKEYGAMLEDHLRQTVLDHIPEAWQRLDEPSMIDQPDYDSFHFWLVHQPIEADEVEQEEGTCLVAKYSVMRDFLRDGKVELQL